MIKTLITPDEVVARAFASGEYLPPESITENMILAVQHRHLTPVIGSALLDAIFSGEHSTLLNDYIAPALAELVRVEANLEQYPPTKTLRRRSKSLLRRLSQHLDEHSADYIEYNSANNILNQYDISGGFVL